MGLVRNSLIVLVVAAALPVWHYFRHVKFPKTRQFPLATNWDGRVTFSPSSWHMASSIEDVRSVICRVRGDGGCRDQGILGKPLKVVGAGHSWSDMAQMENGTLLSLDGMQKVLKEDKKRMRITVEAGMRVKELYDHLASLGWALENVASVNEQSVGGVIAPASHGSGLKSPSMSAHVTSLTIVTARKGTPVYEVNAAGGRLVGGEETKEVSQEELQEWFSSGRAGLGALGVLVAVEFQCMKAFKVHADEFGVNLDYVYGEASGASEEVPDGKGMQELTAKYDYVKIWAIPHTNRALVHGIRRATKEEEAMEPFSTVNGWKEEFDSYLIELANFFAAMYPSLQKPVNTMIGNVRASSTDERLDRSDKLQVIPFRVPYHTEQEMSVPVCNAARLMRATEKSMELQNITSGFIFELRFVAPDDVPLSPEYAITPRNYPFTTQHGSAPPLRPPLQKHWDAPDSVVEDLLGPCKDGSCRACGADTDLANTHRLHVTTGLYNPTEERLRRFFGTFERLSLPLGGRPHWAKNFYSSSKALKAAYPAWDRFLQVRHAIDPDLIFDNPFLRRVFNE